MTMRHITVQRALARVPLFYYVARRPAGFPLAVVYLLWVAVVAGLYPACHWFAGVKSQCGGVLRYF